jgi:hypothetical protein
MLIGEWGRILSSVLNLFLFVLEDKEKVFDAYIVHNQDTKLRREVGCSLAVITR